MNFTICQTQIINIGPLAKDFIEENMLITFKEGVTCDLSDYCFILPENLVLDKPLAINQTMKIGKNLYTITAVGCVATKNFKELGHITIVFDGQKQASLDGAIHVNGEYPNELTIGDELLINE